jgi:guanylate kinase
MSAEANPALPAAAGGRQLFMVVAPSGAGKSSLVNALLARDPGIALSVSYTTRPPRPGEVDGREYHFIDREEFQRRRAQGEFLESAEVHGNFYATSRREIRDRLDAGFDVLLEIDWQGARQVRVHFPQAVGVFILPPSIEALDERLHKRGQDSPAVIKRRMLAAGSEIARAPEFDYIVINEDFNEALAQLTAVVTASRLRYQAQAARHHELFAQLGIPTG